jgi:hypothetical protein
LPGAVRVLFAEHDQLTHFIEVLTREVICELKEVAKEHPRAAADARPYIDVDYVATPAAGQNAAPPSAASTPAQQARETAVHGWRRLVIWSNASAARSRARTKTREADRAERRSAEAERRAAVPKWRRVLNFVLGRGY